MANLPCGHKGQPMNDTRLLKFLIREFATPTLVSSSPLPSRPKSHPAVSPSPPRAFGESPEAQATPRASPATHRLPRAALRSANERGGPVARYLSPPERKSSRGPTHFVCDDRIRRRCDVTLRHTATQVTSSLPPTPDPDR